MKRKTPRFIPGTVSAEPTLERMKPVPVTVSSEPASELKFMPVVSVSYESTLQLKPISVTMSTGDSGEAGPGAVRRKTKALRTALTKKAKAKRARVKKGA